MFSSGGPGDYQFKQQEDVNIHNLTNPANFNLPIPKPSQVISPLIYHNHNHNNNIITITKCSISFERNYVLKHVKNLLHTHFLDLPRQHERIITNEIILIDDTILRYYSRRSFKFTTFCSLLLNSN